MIVCYRSREQIDGCLRGVFAHTAGVEFEVLLVDNSADGTAEHVRRHFPTVRVIDSDRNLGFGAGNNLLAAHARGQYLLLLNPDTIIRDSAVCRLLEFARSRPDGGAWGGLTILPDGRVDPGCMQSGPSLPSVLMHAFGLGSVLTGGLPRTLDRPAEVHSLTGAFMMIRSDLFLDLGGFDESFFLYNEEADLCCRVAATGRKVLLTPQARITHMVGGGTGDRSARMLAQMKGRMQFVSKHRGWVGATIQGVIGWLHAANRVVVSYLARPFLGARRSGAIRATWGPIARDPGTWWYGYSGPKDRTSSASKAKRSAPQPAVAELSK